MKDDADLFREYGAQSIQEAIEGLAVACMGAGIAGPKKIVFAKGDLDKINATFVPKTQTNPPVPATLSKDAVHHFSSGIIELTEE
jgi:hypothetical protein